MKRYRLEISGTKRAGCAGAVEAARRRVEGVRESEVSLDADRASVAAEDPVGLGDLVRAVEGAGYAVSAGSER